MIKSLLNKCILSILVYNLFYRQTGQYFIYIAIFLYTGILAVFMKIKVIKKIQKLRQSD